MKKAFIYLGSLFFMVISQAQVTQALGNNWKNCIIKQSDGNFFVGGFHTTSATNPFINEKFSVVNSNLTSNNSLTNATFGSQNEVFAVENYVTSGMTRGDIRRYVGGSTVLYNSVYVNGLMRITTDGTLDPTFTLNNNTAPSNNAVIRAIATQTNNKIIVGGEFVNYFGVSRSRIVRLNEDGTLDATFNNTGTGFNDAVYAIKIQSDGKILVGGNFTSYNGINRQRLARLNSDGSLDTSFVLNTNFTINNIVRAITIQSDQKVIIGGDFILSNNLSCPECFKINHKRLARINTDGTLDDTFEVNNGFNFSESPTEASVRTISMNGSKIFVGGKFDSYQASTRKFICQLNSNGSLDSDFNTSTIGPDNYVTGSIVESSGNVVIVGNFWKYNDVIKNTIARIQPSGVALRMQDQLQLVSTSKEIANNELTNSVNEISKIVISPNPAFDFINISSSSDELNNFKIVSLDGRILMENKVSAHSKSFTVDMTSFSKGIFLISLETAKGKVYLQRIVKN